MAIFKSEPMAETAHVETLASGKELARSISPENVSRHDPVLEARLRHKFDRRIMPLGIIIFLVAQIDRSNMGNAKILGLVKDTDLTGNRFNICLTAFFVSYVLFEIPANMLCKRFGPRYWLSFTTAGFGLTTIGMSFASSFPALLICRLLLGFFESGVQPGIIFTYSQYYRRHELVSRLGVKAAGTSIAGSFGGLLAGGLGEIPKAGVLEKWRWIFLIEGILTLFVAALVLWLMPTDLMSAKFLTEEERLVAADRIAEENMTKGKDPIDMSVFRRALWNFNTQIVGLGLMMSLLAMTALGLFMPSLLKSMGYSTVHSQLLSVPPYLVSSIVCLGASFLSDRLKTRGFILLTLAPLTVIGFGIMATVESAGIRYFAIFLATTGAFTCSPILLAWVVSNSAGPAVRAIVTAYAVGVGNCGAIIATWTYLPTNGPRYIIGHWINFGAGLIAIVVIVITIFYLKWENNSRAAGKRDYRLEDVTQLEVDRLGHSHPLYKYTV